MTKNKLLTENEIINKAKDLEVRSRNEGVPIIEEDTARYIINLIKENKIKKVLEIGTASSYSAYIMALSGTKVTSIERDLKMYEKALSNHTKYGISNVDVIYADALTINPDELSTYDLIFVDGSKSQYLNFLNKYEKLLNKDGMMLFDNMHFHHLDIKKVKRRTRSLLKKLANFRESVMNNENYKTHLIDIGDGLLLLKRNN